MALNDVQIRAAKAKPKPYKMADGKGLFLQVAVNGSKYWRFKFRFGGKEKLLALGVYPETSLREARTKADEARLAIQGGVDPSLSRRIEKLTRRVIPEDTFRAITEDWHRQRIERWTPKHGRDILRRLEADIFPKLGNRSIKEITAPELLAVLRQIEARGAIEIAHRTRAYCSQIFRYAISIGKAEHDIAADLLGALKVRNVRHHPRLEEQDLPQFFAKLEAYDGDQQTKTAIELLLITFVRTTELRAARWPEFDFEKKIWEIPPERMKMREKHLVPLSRQAIALLEEQKARTGNMPYVFPHRSDPHACMSQNTLLYAFYRMGYHSRATPHGIRATADTILNENDFNRDHIERQLAHAERDNVRAAYNHAQYLPGRTKMMQWWADYLDQQRASALRSQQPRLGQNHQ